jgi:hypothetical protein
MDYADRSNILKKFVHTSSKDSTGNYMTTSAILAKEQGVQGKRKVVSFPITRYMLNSNNKRTVSEISKNLHRYRIQRLDDIATSKVAQILEKIQSFDTNDKTLGYNIKLKNSHKKLASLLSFDLKTEKEKIITDYLTKNTKTLNSNDVSKINSIIKDNNLEKLEKKDMEAIIKQIIIGIETPNQTRYMFSFLQYMQKNNKIDDKAYNLFKTQLVVKIKEELLPKLYEPQSVKDIYSLLSYMDNNNSIDTSIIKKMQQACDRKVRINFRKLISSLTDSRSIDKYRSDKYPYNVDMLRSYINFTKNKNMEISKENLQQINTYIVEGFIKFVAYATKTDDSAKEKIKLINSVKERNVIPIIKFTSKEIARKDYILSYQGKQKAETRQKQLFDRSLGVINDHIMESMQLLRKNTSANTSRLIENIDDDVSDWGSEFGDDDI